MEAEQKCSDCTEELENANRVQSQMIQKLSKDSESMMNLQMELDSATHKISELMNSAPEYLKSQVQKEQHKRMRQAMVASKQLPASLAEVADGELSVVLSQAPSDFVCGKPVLAEWEQSVPSL